MLTPNTPIADISFYCKKIAKKLARLELKTADDLLKHYPTRYEDFSQIKKISELQAGNTATIRARVELMSNYLSPKMHKKITEAIIADNTGKTKVLWFNQWYLKDTLAIGDEYFFTAKINDNYGHELISPDYEKVSDSPTHSARIIPIYSTTAGLSQKEIRTAVKHALPATENIVDPLPPKIIKNNNLPPLSDAIQNIHFPAAMQAAEAARRRLGFEEIFFNHLKNIWLKNNLQKKNAKPLDFHKEKIADFVAALPFRLTDAQRRAAWEILQDIGKPYPMNRLLNGDVGSGKTLVAALAIYDTILSGAQAAVLAPTEILAKQHYNTFCKLFHNHSIAIGLLTGNEKTMNAEQKKYTAESVAADSQLIVGTHAVIQKNIRFKNLALAVIDEQHRFGVEQRAALSSAANDIFPHLLSMTATPIPRTLSLIMYGDLSLSVLDEMPTGRKIIKTLAVPPAGRDDAYKFISKEIIAGRQAFVVCPLISPSDKLGVKSAEEEYAKLKEKIFPQFSIGILHGKMKSTEKDGIMQKFKNKELQILVSTSVIEVGVDVPNATIMLIEGAERFGLAQLHQFRGRVGRGEHQSYCFLFASDGEATSRLKAMEKINDGFRLADLDLKIRGPGALYGTEQSGRLIFRVADMNNALLIKQAMNAADNLFAEDLELKKYPQLREYLEKEKKKVHLE
jgi:ATP-dependent DNA helicase RecG